MGIGGRWHLRGFPETWDGKGSQESMGVALPETYRSGDMEDEEATSCSLTGTSKFLTLNLSNLQEMQGWGMEQRLREWPTNKWPNLRPIPWASINP